MIKASYTRFFNLSLSDIIIFVKKELKRKLLTTTALVSISSSVLLSSTIDNPNEIINNMNIKQNNNIEYASINEDDDILNDYDQENNSDSKNLILNLIYKLPKFIRIIFVVPMWFLGTFISFMINKLLSPILGIIIDFIVSTLISLLIIVICVKILFPNLSLKKILNKKTILTVVISNFILFILDIIMPHIYPDYTFYRNLFKLIVRTIIIIILLIPFIKLFIKNNKKARIIIPKL